MFTGYSAYNQESKDSSGSIVPHIKLFTTKNYLTFLIYPQNIMLSVLIRSALGTYQGASNEYPQHMFSRRNRKLFTLLPLFFGAMKETVKTVITTRI